MSLRIQTFSAVRWTALATAARTLLRFGQMALLARMLAPADFGLMAIVVSVTAFMQVFADLGVSTAIIHYQDVTQTELSSLYWLNLIFGAILAMVLIAASPWISGLIFHQPSLQPILMLMSANFIFLAAGQQLRVVAEKGLRFPLLARVEIPATLGGCVTAVVWAWYSPTVYALAVGFLVNSFLQAAFLWLFVSAGWRPDFRIDLRGAKKFLRFGAYIMGGDFINSLYRQADILIGGRVFPAALVGIYSLPRNLCTTVVDTTNPIITRVGLPVMAKAQHDRAFLKSVYLKTMRMTASTNFPVFLALAFFSRDVVLLLFGSKWTSSAPLLSVLAFFGMFRSCINPVGSLLLAVGKANLQFRWHVATLLLVFPGLWVASHFGIEGLAAGQASVMGVLVIPCWYFLIRPHCDARLGEYLLALLQPLAAGLFAIITAYLAVAHLHVPALRLAGAALIAVPAYLAASMVVNRSWVTAMRQLVFRQ